MAGGFRQAPYAAPQTPRTDGYGTCTGQSIARLRAGQPNKARAPCWAGKWRVGQESGRRGKKVAGGAGKWQAGQQGLEAPRKSKSLPLRWRMALHQDTRPTRIPPAHPLSNSGGWAFFLRSLLAPWHSVPSQALAAAHHPSWPRSTLCLQHLKTWNASCPIAPAHPARASFPPQSAARGAAQRGSRLAHFVVIWLWARRDRMR